MDVGKYLNGIIGTKATDEDGYAGVQCVDLAKRYLRECFGKAITALGDGAFVAQNVAKLYPNEFTFIPYFNGIVPQVGDIVSFHSSGSSAQYGHVGIVNKSLTGGKFSIIDQWNGSGTVRTKELTVIAPKYGVSNSLIGIARPKLDVTGTQVTPFVSLKDVKIGDIVQFAGGKVFSSSTSLTAATTKPESRCKVTSMASGTHPYHLISEDGKAVHGWVDAANITVKSKTYTVKTGDTLSGIAQKYGTDWKILQKINSIADANKIYAGQVLTLP